MADDPWAVVQSQPAAAAPADDPWAVKSAAPVSAPAPKAAAPAAAPADDPLHQVYGWMQKYAKDKIAEYQNGPKPQVPDMPNPLGDIADQIVHHASSLLPWQPFGAPSEKDGVFSGIVKGAANMATRGIDSAVAPVRAAGSIANDTLGGAQHALVTKPLSQATGVPEDTVNLALMAGLPEKPAEAAAGRPAPKGRGTAETPPSAAPEAAAGPWDVKAQEPVAEAAAPAAEAAADPWAVKAQQPVEPPEEPGPILEDRPKGEQKLPEDDMLAAQSTRTDDALNRLTKNAVADKIEARQFIESQPPEVADPAVQEKLYGEIEARMVNPDAPLSPEAQVAFDALKPWKDEETQLGQKLTDMGYGEEHSIDPNAYVHRVARGQGSYLDAADAAASADPVMGDRQGPGTRSLSRSTSSQQARKFFVLEDAEGNRQFVKDPSVAATLKAGEPVWDQLNNTKVTPKHATTAEIEANTGQRYVKNAMVNTVDNVLRLRRAARNAEVLEGLKKQMGQNGLIHFDQTPGQPPEHYERLTMPQFKGAFADPRIAHILNDFHGELARGGDLAQLGAKVNRALTGAIFFTPVPHMWNVANHWAIARGFDWLRPGAYKNLMTDGARAVKAVITQNDDYQRMLREGSGLMYGGVANKDFHTAMIKKLGGEIEADPKGWAPISKMFGYANPANLVKAIYKLSSKSLWSVSDMFMLQRQFELMRKGMPVRQAIAEAEKDIPNYRAPSYIGGNKPINRALAEVLKNPNLFMFGRYRYGQFKAYAHLLDDMKGSPAERKEAGGRLFVMAAMAMGGYPVLNAILKGVTGNKDAEVHKGGGMSIPSAVYDVMTGKKSWGQGMSSIVQPSPAVETLVEALHNKDSLGRNIIEPGSTLKGKGLQALEYAGSKVAPVSSIMTATKPDGGAAQAAGNLVALSLPRPATAANKAKSSYYDQRRAARREARDPIISAISSLSGKK